MSEGPAFIPKRYVLAEFATAEAMLAATKTMRERGHRGLDTHTPYPVHGIEEALGLGRPIIPKIVLLGAITGACLAYGMIYFMNGVDFPINVANRPPHSPILNVPVTFELAVLLGGISAFAGTLGLAKLPQPYHPLFESESFRRASIDGFFLSIEVPEGQSPQDIVKEVRELEATDVQTVTESER